MLSNETPEAKAKRLQKENTDLKQRVASLTVDVVSLESGAHRLQDKMFAIEDLATRHGWTREHDLVKWLETRLAEMGADGQE